MNLSFRNRMLLTISFACAVCTLTAIVVSSRKLEENGKDALMQKSRAVLSRLEVGAGYVAAMGTLEAVIEETMKKYPDGQVPEDQKLKVLKSVPIFAAFKIGQTGAKEENYEFRIASDAPRNRDNAATPEERSVIDRFRADPSLKEITQVSEDDRFVRVSRPVRIVESRQCLSCHGNPTQSPWKNGKDILGYPMENMKDGDLRGTFTIVSSLEPVKAAVKASTRNLVLWGASITILALLLGFAVIRGPIARIGQIARDLSKSSTDVASASSEIASTSDRLSTGADEQASALQQTSASTEEVRAMVGKNSDYAQQSIQSANESQAAAEKGKTVVQEMIQSIDEIQSSNRQIMNQVNESNQRMSEIVQVISNIGDKTKVINDIVFQTKLLSFNASVEAARAGEHGKGFAVVAEEVGNLAQMSGNAAKEITSMLSESVQKVETIAHETKEKVEALIQAGQEKIASGTAVANRCGEVLDEIVGNAAEMNQTIGKISSSSAEQSRGVEEITRAVTQLDQVTQQNAEDSRRSAGAADQLSQQAQLLRRAVQSLISSLDGRTEAEVIPIKGKTEAETDIQPRRRHG